MDTIYIETSIISHATAIAALAGVQYLLTLNCRHIANARALPRVYQLLDELGLPGMLICTPMEFLGDSLNV